MTKKQLFPCLGILSVILLVMVIFMTKDKPKHSSAHDAVAAIEDYRKKHGKLPDTDDHDLLSKLGISSAGSHPVNYYTLENGHYLLVRLSNLEEPQWYYDSRTQKWARGTPPIPHP